jgi:hypothetical protein
MVTTHKPTGVGRDWAHGGKYLLQRAIHNTVRRQIIPWRNEQYALANFRIKPDRSNICLICVVHFGDHKDVKENNIILINWY